MSKEKELSIAGSSEQPEVEEPKKGEKKDTEEAKGLTNDQLVDLIISKKDDEIIPWESVYLPSRGLYYDGKIPDGKVEVRAMGLFAEKILATQRLAQTGKALDYMFQKCVKFPTSFDPLDLLAGDRIFLLYYIRGITYGNEYEFSITCSNASCGAVSIHTYDLNELASTQTIADPSIGEEPFMVKLPHMSKQFGKDIWVGIRFLRGRDIQRMMTHNRNIERITDNRARTRSRHQKKEADEASPIAIDQTLEQNLNLVIVSIMGVTDPVKIRQFVSKLHSRDTTEIREFLREKSPSIDTTVEITCPECKQDFTVDLPISDSFFRPATPGPNG